MDTPWNVTVVASAEKELDDLRRSSPGCWLEIVRLIGSLTEDPFPPDSILLDGRKYTYRVKACSAAYRVIYRVSAQKRRIIVRRIRARNEVYKGI